MKILETNRAHLFDIAIAILLAAISINCSVGAESETAVKKESGRQESSVEQADENSSPESKQQTTSVNPEGKTASSEPPPQSSAPESSSQASSSKSVQQETSSQPAEQKPEKSNGEANSASNPPAPQPSGRTRLTEMKLSGSMCMSCLHEVERKLKLIQGVSKAKIEYPGERYYDYYQSPGLNSWARLTLSYDPAMIDLVSIKAFLRNQGYHPFKIVEKEK